jgi:hypothetical protein
MIIIDKRDDQKNKEAAIDDMIITSNNQKYLVVHNGFEVQLLDLKDMHAMRLHCFSLEIGEKLLDESIIKEIIKQDRIEIHIK